jgi:hypothetical protein
MSERGKVKKRMFCFFFPFLRFFSSLLLLLFAHWYWYVHTHTPTLPFSGSADALI